MHSPIRQIVVTFSEEMNPLDANSPANYDLRCPGPNGLFDDADDIRYEIVPHYATGSVTTVVDIVTAPLPPGAYRLTLSGNTTLRDLAGLRLDGDGDGQEGGNFVPPTIKLVPNRLPVADDDAYTAVEDGQLLVAAAAGVLQGDTDPDSDTLSAVLVIGPSHGSLTLNADGSFLYIPAADFFGQDQFTYRLDDGNEGTDQAVVAIEVSGINETPIAVDDAFVLLEDTTLDVSAALGLLANDRDIDQDVLSVRVLVPPQHDYFCTDAFSYDVQDAAGAADSAGVQITILPVNDPPVAVLDRTTTEFQESVTIDVLANDYDVDGQIDRGSLAVTQIVGQGTAIVNADGTLTYTPAAGFDGSETVRYVIRDNDGAVSATGTVRVRVNPVPEFPWQNPNSNYDVNANGRISPFDVVLVINNLNLEGARPLPAPDPFHLPPPYYDVSGNRFISPFDALLVVNYLNYKILQAQALSDAMSQAEGEFVRDLAEPSVGRTTVSNQNWLGKIIFTSADREKVLPRAGRDLQVRPLTPEFAPTLGGASVAHVGGGSESRCAAERQAARELDDLEAILDDIAEDVSRWLAHAEGGAPCAAGKPNAIRKSPLG